MPRAGTLLRNAAVTILFGVVLLLPVTASCKASAVEPVELDEPSLTLNWRFGEPGCDIMLTGSVTERGRLHLSAKLACRAAEPEVQRVDAGSARL